MVHAVWGQPVSFQSQNFDRVNVTTSVVNLKGGKAIRVERDLKALPFDVNRLEATVDEPTFIRLRDVDFENGTIEVKMKSQIQEPSPFRNAHGFIGVAFRISPDDTTYESVYLRPRVGRSNDQQARNRAVQYYSYPHYKFNKLRQESPGKYETAAPIALDEWITMRLEVNGWEVHVFLNDNPYSTLIVSPMRGSTSHGAIGLWVDIGTIGYFRDLKIMK